MSVHWTKQRIAAAALGIAFVLAVVTALTYVAGRRAGRTPQVVEGAAQVLSTNQIVMDATAGEPFPGGTGTIDVTGAWWTADGVTHPGNSQPSCLVPGTRPRVRLAVLEVRADEQTGPGRWVVTHVECLS